MLIIEIFLVVVIEIPFWLKWNFTADYLTRFTVLHVYCCCVSHLCQHIFHMIKTQDHLCSIFYFQCKKFLLSVHSSFTYFCSWRVRVTEGWLERELCYSCVCVCVCFTWTECVFIRDITITVIVKPFIMVYNVTKLHYSFLDHIIVLKSFNII